MPVNPETQNPTGAKHPHKGGGGKKGKGWHPPKGVGGAISHAGGEAAHAAGGSRHNRKKNRRKVRRIQKRNTRRANREAWKEAESQSVQTLSANTAPEKQRDLGWKPSVKDIIGNQIEADIRATDPGAIHPVVGAASQIAKPLANALVTVGFPEKAGPQAAVTVGGKIIKSLGKGSRTIERTAARGATREAEKVAVRTGERAAAKSEARAADKQIAREAKARTRTKVTSRVKSTVKRQAKKRRPTILSGKAATKGATNERVRKAVIAGGIAGPVVAGPGAAVVQNTIEAAKEDPEKFLKTSGSAVGGIATAPVKIAAEAVESVKAGSFKPLEGELDAQLDYWKQYPELANPGSEKAQRMILRKYGATPLLTGALGVHAATRPIKAMFPKSETVPEPKVARQGLRVRRVSKIREDTRSADPNKAEPAQRALMAAGRRRGAKRRSVAREMDVSDRRARASFARDMKETGTVAGKSRTTAQSMRSLAEIPLGRDKNYSLADAVQVVHRYGIPLDAERGRAALVEVRDSLTEPGRIPSPQARSTRYVLNALIENPEVLEHSDFARLEQAIAKIRADQADTPTPPDPRDRARHVAQARTHDVHTPEERVPHELRKVTSMAPKKYEDAYKRLRAKANDLIRRAKRKEAQAKVLKPDDPKRATLEGEAETFRAQAARIREVVNRPNRARKLDAEAFAARQAGDLDAEASLRAQALALRQQHQASRSALDEEFHAEMRGVREAKGLREPIFFHDRAAYDVGEPTRGGKPVTAAGAAKADKVKLGLLSEQGLVDESGNSLIEGIYRDRANAEMNQALQRILGDNVHGRLLTGEQARKIMAEGRAPAGYSLIPLQDFKRAYARGDWEAALGIIKDETGMRNKIGEADFVGKGKKYAWIPTSILDETYAQAQGIGKFAKGLKAFGGAQSLLLLGTSPTWAFYQGFATPLVLAARHPNPVTWMKAARDAARMWRKFSPRERAAFNAVFGGNVGDVQGHFKFNEVGPTFDNIRSFSDASKLARQTWPGRLLGALTRNGGPIIRGVARYEGALRTVEALMEADKLYGRTAATRWVHSLADLDAETRRSIDAVKGMSFEERTHYLSDPQNTKPLERRVMSTLGDWTSMTAREKKLTGAFIFYPFLRFSLKWLFHTFPRDNPIKAAILLNLAQQNADEVRDLLGGEPQFFQSFGLVPFRGEDGKVHGALNMARAAPGSNALIEGLAGQEELNLSAASRILQPAVAAVVLQGIGGLDPYTGEKVGHSLSDNFMLFSKQILNLNPISRAFLIPKIEQSSQFLEPSATAEWFRALGGHGPAAKAFNPFASFTTTKSLERAKYGAGEILDKAGAAPTPEEIGQMADHIAQQYPNLNQAQLREKPEVQEFIRRARVAEKNSDLWASILEAGGFGYDPAVDHTFKNLMALVKPIGGFGGKPIDKRTEAQRVRFLKRNKGLTGKQVQQQYPGLPTAYASRIEALRRSGMTDEQIAAKYPYLRKHLSSPSSSSGSWGSSSWGSGGSDWGSSGSSWGSSGWGK